MKNKRLLRIFIHLCFCASTLLFFRFNSWFRPIALGAFYKEYIAGALVLSVFYLNFFVLYPQLYLKRRFSCYVMTSFLSLVVAAVTEERLVYRQTLEIVQNLNINHHHYFIQQTLWLLIRDSCFYFFSFFASTVYSLNKEKENLYQYLYHHNHLIVAKGHHNTVVTIPIREITHCQQSENYAKIHLLDGNCYTRNCTMSTLAEDFGPDCSVRISRSIIVMYDYIQSFDENTVYIQTHEGIKGFNITKSYREQTLSLLKSHIKKETVIEKTEDSEEDISLSENNQEMVTRAKPNEEMQNLEKSASQLVLDYIKRHPDCKGSNITQVCRLSLSTVNRTLKQLKDEGLIEYTGSKKTGGYRVKEDAI